MKVIMFDYDGVIADSFEVVHDIFNSVCEKYGLKQMNKEEFIQLYNENFYEKVIHLGMNKKDIPSMINDFKQGFLNKKDSIHVFDAMDKIVNALSEKNTVVIVTSTETSAVKQFLQKFGINVKEVLGADVATSKIEKINMIKEKYGESDYYFVTDTSGDVLEGKQTGVKTIGITWGYHPKELLETAAPDYIFTTPEQLLTFFQ